MMLRECARNEALVKIMLYSEDFYNFFKYVEVSTFDIASDAFSTFKVMSCMFTEFQISKKFKVYRLFLLRSYLQSIKPFVRSSWKTIMIKSSAIIKVC